MLSREAVRAATGMGFATDTGFALGAVTFGCGLAMGDFTGAAFLAFGAEAGLRAFVFVADLPAGFLAARFLATFFEAGFLTAFLVFLVVFLVVFATVLLARFFDAAAAVF